MYELVKVTEKVFYVDAPTKVGVVRLNDTDVVSIDSGSDKDAGKKLLRALDASGWKLRSIYATHAHADHIGANRYLQDRTGCTVYGTDIEACFTRNPLLEPAYVYCADPLPELRGKFLTAQPSRAELLTEDRLPAGVTMFPLPGHYWQMTGFRTDEDVVFLADSLCSEQTLQKYAITFLVDVEAYLNTLESIKTMQARCFIPAHAPVTEDIVLLAQKNIDVVHDIAERIVSLCTEPVMFEELLRRLFVSYAIPMNLTQYALIGNTMRTYLSWLYAKKRVRFFFDSERMLWERT